MPFSRPDSFSNFIIVNCDFEFWHLVLPLPIKRIHLSVLSAFLENHFQTGQQLIAHGTAITF